MKMKWFAILADENGNLTNTGIEIDNPGDLMVTYSEDRNAVIILVYAVNENQAKDSADQIYKTAKKAWGKNLTWKYEIV